MEQLDGQFLPALLDGALSHARVGNMPGTSQLLAYVGGYLVIGDVALLHLKFEPVQVRVPRSLVCDSRQN